MIDTDPFSLWVYGAEATALPLGQNKVINEFGSPRTPVAKKVKTSLYMPNLGINLMSWMKKLVFNRRNRKRQRVCAAF